MTSPRDSMKSHKLAAFALAAAITTMWFGSTALDLAPGLSTDTRIGLARSAAAESCAAATYISAPCAALEGPGTE